MRRIGAAPLTGAEKSARYLAAHPDRCREAKTVWASKRYRRHRALLNQYKLARGCADCGFRAHPAALEFDHLPGVKKAFSVGNFGTRSLECLLAEVAKCEVVCANCHAIRTATRRAD